MQPPLRLLHIAELEVWLAAQEGGRYRAASLDDEGFIHASTPDQVLATAQRHYQGRTGLMLLVIDPELTAAEWVWEPSSAVGEDFPHLYGELETAAVVAWSPFNPDHQELPPGLAK